MNQQPWHHNLQLGNVDDIASHDSMEWLEEKLVKLLVKDAVEHNKVLVSKVFRGFFEIESKEKIDKFFTTDRQLIYSRCDSEYSEHAEDHLYLDDSSVVSIGFSSDNNVCIDLHTTDMDFMEEAKKLMTKTLTKRSLDNLGKAHVLATAYDGLTTREIDAVGVPLNLENYSESVRKGLTAIVEDLRSPLPTGKLILLKGEPGTGKTFCVRSLITEVPNAFFVIVPASMVKQLGDPALIPVLLRLKSKEDALTDEEMLEKSSQKEEKASNPIVIIVEDADECLVSRERGDMGAISTILNITSGILGDMLDIRVIATTNAKETEMDPAILRDGRMSYHLEVGRLNYAEANSVFKRLMGDKKGDLPDNRKSHSEGFLLATVYKEAKLRGYREKPASESNTNVEKKKRKRIGFSP